MCPFGGGPQLDAIVLKASYAAGYRGQLMDTAPIPGGVMLALASAGLVCGEYAPNKVKKSVVGRGHADKRQVAAMVSVLLALRALAPGDDLRSSGPSDR